MTDCTLNKLDDETKGNNEIHQYILDEIETKFPPDMQVEIKENLNS